MYWGIPSPRPPLRSHPTDAPPGRIGIRLLSSFQGPTRRGSPMPLKQQRLEAIHMHVKLTWIAGTRQSQTPRAVPKRHLSEPKTRTNARRFVGGSAGLQPCEAPRMTRLQPRPFGPSEARPPATRISPKVTSASAAGFRALGGGGFQPPRISRKMRWALALRARTPGACANARRFTVEAQGFSPAKKRPESLGFSRGLSGLRRRGLPAPAYPAQNALGFSP